jgi:transposase-like protein
MRKNREENREKQDIAELTERTFMEAVQGEVRRAILAMMEREVDLLCGEAYHPREGGCRRAGSEVGRGYWDGEAHRIIRPRVRAEGQEIRLKSYQAARSRKGLTPEIIGMVEGGMSLRGIERLNRRGFSASTAQKAWVEESAKAIDQLRRRDLSGEKFFALMVDGVFLSREMVVVVALGFLEDGSKKVLDFVIGSTESYEVCRELMGRLHQRGFRAKSLLAVIDGGEGLRKAILEMFPQAKIQRCWVHKERNLHGYLRHSHRGECSRLIERIRHAQGREAGEEAFEELRVFLQKRNQAAYQSLLEAQDDLLTLHRLNVPATLHRTFLSTNAIENVIHNFRRHTDRVKRWQPQTDQAERWTATALLMAEEGFRKIPHHQDIPQLLAALAASSSRRAPASDCVTVEANPSDSSTTYTPSEAERKLRIDGILSTC